MKKLLIKEIRLAASPLSFIFIAAALMTMLPGYPILMSAFFICLGLFYSFLNAREMNDVLYTVMLPVGKHDFVRAKYAFAVLIQLAGLLICAALTAIRMTVLSESSPYVNNSLMNATPVYLAFVLLVFASFNVFFIGGFFRTAYKIGMPFILFGIVSLILISVAEALPHFPGLEFLKNPAGERPEIQFTILACSVAVYCAATALSLKKSEERFEKIDL